MSTRGHVAFVIPTAYPLGGVATWLDYLLPGLQNRGWQIDALMVDGRFHDANTYLSQHPFEPVRMVANPSGTREGRINVLAKALRELAPDIVVAANLPDTYPAVRRSRTAGNDAIQSVMTVHGLQADLMQDIREFAPLIDHVVCTNRLTCQVVNKMSEFPTDKTHYAPYGVPVGELPNRTAGDRGPLRLIHVGRLEQDQKRIMDLPDIAEGLRDRGVDFTLKIIGSGPDEAALAAAIQKRNLQEVVHLQGVVPHERLATEVYDHADVLLLTPEWETGPIVAWEAMSRGVAVVSSAYVGSGLEGSLVHEQNCLLYPVGDCEAAVSQVARLVEPDLRKELAGAGFELVTARYSHAASISAWDNCLTHIFQRPDMASGRASTSPPPAGRLDRMLGTSLAEHCRRLLGIRYRHRDAGGEWPHSYGGAPSDRAFFEAVRQLEEAS